MQGKEVDVTGRTVDVDGSVEYEDSRTQLRMQDEAALRRFALVCWAGVVISHAYARDSHAEADWAGMARAAVFLGITNVDPAEVTDDSPDVAVSVPENFQLELDHVCRKILDERDAEWKRLARVLDKRSVLSGTEVHRLLGEEWFGSYA